MMRPAPAPFLRTLKRPAGAWRSGRAEAEAAAFSILALFSLRSRPPARLCNCHPVHTPRRSFRLQITSLAFSRSRRRRRRQIAFIYLCTLFLRVCMRFSLPPCAPPAADARCIQFAGAAPDKISSVPLLALSTSSYSLFAAAASKMRYVFALSRCCAQITPLGFCLGCLKCEEWKEKLQIMEHENWTRFSRNCVFWSRSG